MRAKIYKNANKQTEEKKTMTCKNITKG